MKKTKKDKKLDPRQIRFLELYLDPNSDTFGSATSSAVKAGFSKEYAKTITTKNLKWLSENVSDLELVKKALDNLEEFLNEKEDKKIKADITKFVLERLHKKKFSQKSEVEHSVNKEQVEKLENIMRELSNGKK